MVRYLQQHGRHWFPQMLNRSQMNKRIRELSAVLVRLQQVLTDRLYDEEAFEVVDCTPLHTCSLSQAASYETHWLNGKLGRGGNSGGWYYGEQLLLSVTADGVITGWLVGLAQIDDRWMLEAFLSTREGEMSLTGPQPPKKKIVKKRIN